MSPRVSEAQRWQPKRYEKSVLKQFGGVEHVSGYIGAYQMHIGHIGHIVRDCVESRRVRGSEGMYHEFFDVNTSRILGSRLATKASWENHTYPSF